MTQTTTTYSVVKQDSNSTHPFMVVKTVKSVLHNGEKNEYTCNAREDGHTFMNERDAIHCADNMSRG